MESRGVRDGERTVIEKQNIPQDLPCGMFYFYMEETLLQYLPHHPLHRPIDRRLIPQLHQRFT